MDMMAQQNNGLAKYMEYIVVTVSKVPYSVQFFVHYELQVLI